MANVDPDSPIPADLGKPLQTFQEPGPSTFMASMLAMLTFRKNPFGLLTITLCENGIAARDTRIVPNRQVLRNKDIRWDEFVTVQSSLMRTIQVFTSDDFNLYAYELADGSTFGLVGGTGMKNVDSLARLIQDQIYSRQFPRLAAAFSAGQTLDFGPLQLDQSGLNWESEQIPWKDIAEIKVDKGKLTLQRTGVPDLEMYVYEIKNFDILWTLLTNFLEARKG